MQAYATPTQPVPETQPQPPAEYPPCAPLQRTDAPRLSSHILGRIRQLQRAEVFALSEPGNLAYLGRCWRLRRALTPWAVLLPPSLLPPPPGVGPDDAGVEVSAHIPPRAALAPADTGVGVERDAPPTPVRDVARARAALQAVLGPAR